MADLLGRVGRFISPTSVQRSKPQENERPIEPRASGKRSVSMASRSAVKSLKSRAVSIGAPKKAKPAPASKPPSDKRAELELTLDEQIAIEGRPARKIRAPGQPLVAPAVNEATDRMLGEIRGREDWYVDRELGELIRGLNAMEFFHTLDPEQPGANAELAQVPKHAHLPDPLTASAIRTVPAAKEADDAIRALEVELNADSAQSSIASIPRERAMPAMRHPLTASASRDLAPAAKAADEAIRALEEQLKADSEKSSIDSIPSKGARPAPLRVDPRPLNRQARPLPTSPNPTSPERRGPFGRGR